MSRYVRPRPAPARRPRPVAAIPWQHGAEPVPTGRLLRLAIAAAVLILAMSAARAAEPAAASPHEVQGAPALLD